MKRILSLIAVLALAVSLTAAVGCKKKVTLEGSWHLERLKMDWAENATDDEKAEWRAGLQGIVGQDEEDAVLFDLFLNSQNTELTDLTYTFEKDGKGSFVIEGGDPIAFTWERDGNVISTEVTGSTTEFILDGESLYTKNEQPPVCLYSLFVKLK